MAEPFLSELRLFSFVFAPKSWALCNGQLMPINQNQALFSLLGTTFGGNGQTNFALPDLRGRVPMHVGSGHTLGENGGEQAHTLTISELPTHTPRTAGDHDGGEHQHPQQYDASGFYRPERLYTGPAALTPSRRDGRQCRREPGASQHAAVSDVVLVHRAAGHLPLAQLRNPTDGATLCR